MTTTAPYQSGFCGLRLPASSHARCPQVVGAVTCGCECHQQPEVVDLADALSQLCTHLCGFATRGHDPICTTVRRHLHQEPS